MKKWIEHLPRHAGALYLVLGVSFLAAAVVAAFHSVSFGWMPLVHWTVGDAATACAGFATVAAIFFGLQQFSSQRAVERSKFAMDMSMEGVRQAYQVLQSDFPTRNMAWVNAARLILRAVETSAAITSKDHRTAWDLFREEWRIKIFGTLRASTEFFCGIGDWDAHPTKISIDDAFANRVAQAAQREIDFSTPSIGATSFGDTLVNENAIKIIYDFTEYGPDWRDPIKDRGGFEAIPSAVMFQRDLFGLWGYVELRRKYVIGSGEAKRRASLGESED